MSETPIRNAQSSTNSSASLVVKPAFMLLFPIQPRDVFKGFDELPPGIAPLPPEESQAYKDELIEFEQKLLGKTFLEAQRIMRWPLGRIVLDNLPEGAPTHADVYLLTHKSGVALWEVWLPAHPGV
jgi:hypothetical protein